MNDDFVIQTTHLTKYFGRKCAVDGVSLAVPRGQVTALLGRNGSGKTTLLRMILGLLPPTRGSARLLSDDAASITPATRARVGYVAETHPLYDWMTVRQFAQYQSRFHPATWDQSLFDSVVGHFALSPAARIASLSRGERAGVSLAATLAPSPELLILDDPALGLDPVARRLLLESMVQFTRDGRRTILFSSHLLADVERVADRVAVLDRSVLRVDASVETFRSRVRQWLLVFPDQVPPNLPPLPGLLSVRRDHRELRVTVANPDDATARTLASLHPARMTETPVSLEDAVIGYLGASRTTDGGSLTSDTTQRGAA